MTTAAPVRRDFLERLSRHLLARLLEPFAAPLHERGFSLDALAASLPKDRTLPRRLFALLTDEDAPPPLGELSARLAAVGRLGNSRGRESLVSFDHEGVMPKELGPEDFAATAFLDHPQLFERARGGATPDIAKGFVVYSATPTATVAIAPANIEAVRASLSAFFESRHRTAFCDIQVTRRGPEHHFEVMHGQAPATLDLIERDLQANVVTQVNGQRSYVIYNEETLLLSVHAVEFLKEPLRASFGHGLTGAPSSFERAHSLIDLSRLTDLDRALAPEPEVGVVDVELRSIVLRMRDGSTTSLAGGGGDLRRSMQNTLVACALTQLGATPIELKMAVSLHLEGGSPKRPLLVEIRGLRNQLDYDRRDRRAEAALLTWLSMRGIWNGTRRADGITLQAAGQSGE